MSFENSAAWALDGSAPGLAHGLRPMTWHGLCAQITAMQDLRRALAHQPVQDETGSVGSFDAGTAALIVAGFSGASAQVSVRKSPVNPNSSVNGKALLAKSDDAMTGVWTDRIEARD